MNRILIRCDASLSIGSGHVMRCRTLARELQRCGANVSFLCRPQPGDLISILEQEFEVLSLPEQPLSACDGLKSRDLYRAWLGCTQEQDAAHCLEVIAKAGINGVSWIVADHYGLDALWEEQLLAGLYESGAAPKLLVIDDLADRPHLAALLLDQNFFGEATYQRYKELVPPECLQLLGPHYALLGSEYAQLHPVVPPRNELRRVLVFFGGVDPDNLTARALEALRDPALTDLAVDVVLGHHSPHRQAVAEMVASRPNTTLHGPLPTLAGLMARADLAIGAGGATTWERACLGLPSLVVAIAANQLPFSEALDQVGHLKLLSDRAGVTAEQICSALLSLIAEPKLIRVASVVTDGWGASRLSMAMLGPQRPISLRPVTAADEAPLSNWANDPYVHDSSYSPDPIADHNKWIQKGLANPNRLQLIATSADGCPIGQFLLDRQESSTHSDAFEAKLWLSLDRCTHGHSLTAQLVHLGLQAMAQRWGPSTKAVTPALHSNTVSNACFARACLTPDSELLSDSLSPVSGGESLSLPPGRVTLLSDRGSWLNAFLPDLICALWQRGHAVRWIHSPSALCAGDVCLLLSCGRLLSSEQLALHRHNLVVHASALPQGQGWSPMTWQILQGASAIPITLFEAVAELDAGSIYLKQKIPLKGHELADEWRVLLAQATSDLCLAWFDRHQEVMNSSQTQYGKASHYRRRRPADSQLDPELSLAEQFNLLRVVDNRSYPAFFYWCGRRYVLNLQSD